MTDKALDNSSRRIITIGRQFGAGGRSVGKLVANKLGINFYDKELIAEAAKVSGLSDKFITHMDEQHTSSLLYSLILHAQTPGIFGKGKPIELLAYDAQIASVKAVASKGPRVIVGRAADCILWDEYDVMSFFLTAPLSDRICHVAERDSLSKDEAAQKISRLDKARESIYNSFSDRKWAEASSYDMCLNVAQLGVEAAADIILKFLESAHAGGQKY